MGDHAKIKFLACSILFALAPILASAHQPRLAKSFPIAVDDPEISKAYYGELVGEPNIYLIGSSEDFDLYVNILVPDLSGQEKDISAAIIKEGKMIAVLDGENYKWEKFFEPFGHDNYWKGPEQKIRAEPGSYEIVISSEDNKGKYALAIGEIEKFGFKESVAALAMIPQLKRGFFEKSPADFILSPLGLAEIAAILIAAALTYFIFRGIRIMVFKDRMGEISKIGRLFRVAAGLALITLAVLTSWNPAVFFLSGLLLSEAAFGKTAARLGKMEI